MRAVPAVAENRTIRRASRRDPALRAVPAVAENRTIRRARVRGCLPWRKTNIRRQAGGIRCRGACRGGKPNYPPGKPAGFVRCAQVPAVAENRTIRRASRRDSSVARCLLWRKTEPSTGQAGGIPALRAVPAVAENRTIHRASRRDSCVARCLP